MLQVLAAGAIGAPTQLNPVELFLHADVVVESVMGGLLLASVWVWMIIIGFTIRLTLVTRRCRKYETGFWEARDIDAFQKEQDDKDIPTARVVTAALGEWRRSTAGKTIDRDGTRQRLSAAMDGAVTEETDRLATRLNFLATVGTVAPFVGLFGTVWGVMDSFFVSERNRIHRWRSLRREFRRRCLPLQSGCLPRSRRWSPTTGFRTG